MASHHNEIPSWETPVWSHKDRDFHPLKFSRDGSHAVIPLSFSLNLAPSSCHCKWNHFFLPSLFMSKTVVTGKRKLTPVTAVVRSPPGTINALISRVMVSSRRFPINVSLAIRRNIMNSKDTFSKCMRAVSQNRYLIKSYRMSVARRCENSIYHSEHGRQVDSWSGASSLSSNVERNNVFSKQWSYISNHF